MKVILAFIALGANLGDARATILKAMADVGHLPQTWLLRQSSLYATVPLDSEGPDYINAVIEVATGLTAPALLVALQALEKDAGRVRPHRNAPRTLDLDILLYGNLAINTPSLTVPHPRMLQRAFVLAPLSEIAPQRVSAAQLEAVQRQIIEKLALPHTPAAVVVPGGPAAAAGPGAAVFG